MNIARIAYLPRYLVCYTLIASAVPVLALVALCTIALAVIDKAMVWVSQ